MSFFKSFLFLCILSLSSFANDGIINIDEIAKKEAKIEKKQIMVFFHMTRCPYCIKMINNAFSDKIAKQKMEKDYSSGIATFYVYKRKAVVTNISLGGICANNDYWNFGALWPNLEQNRSTRCKERSGINDCY